MGRMPREETNNYSLVNESQGLLADYLTLNNSQKTYSLSQLDGLLHSCKIEKHLLCLTNSAGLH